MLIVLLNQARLDWNNRTRIRRMRLIDMDGMIRINQSHLF